MIPWVIEGQLYFSRNPWLRLQNGFCFFPVDFLGDLGGGKGGGSKWRNLLGFGALSRALHLRLSKCFGFSHRFSV